ncbi:phytoene desaturase [Lacibacter cauensis]|uniref:Phytoene desaturase n=1 Tax=Lacibacter cauensis TaxID=510947 RepID=A0A562SJE5_9BACT|nr:phytoene desaturase family protein [Lacibacter cauensis]TWI81381.1 phytoene desaturase [Lacibacter cauensis]
MVQKAIVIGSGFAGMSAASFLAKAGWHVTVLEKHDQPGGRARQLQVDGFTFDMGPSWYWMPDVFERYFNLFGKKVNDYYELKRLDPSYRIYFKHDVTDIPADYDALKKLFDELEPGSSKQLDAFMDEAAYKYEVGINKLVHKPGLSLSEFADMDLVKGIFKLDVFTSMKKHVQKHFADSRLRELMEFPVLFLGALPEKIPALYSLMNYADVKLGTWYPVGGMYEIVKGMHSLAEELGVQFQFNRNVEEIKTVNGRATGVVADGEYLEADVVISGADYHFTETKLLHHHDQSYSEAYWNNRVMAPSCLLYYVGLNKQLPQIPHHSLFFDTDFNQHGQEIYDNPQWPSNPLFYVSATTRTDASGAPAGCENLFFLIPVAAGLEGDTEEVRDRYFQQIVQRFEQRIGEPILDSIVYKKSYSVTDFKDDYNAFRGNAYGLANTLLQTAILKPGCRSKKVENLYYTGQLTVPGPGVPPSLISGEVVASLVHQHYSKTVQTTERL